MAQFQFDASQHAAAMNFDALPKGWYKGQVIESKARETAAKGQALDFVIEILEPAFAKGRKVFVGFNVVHPTSADTVRIAYEQLAALSIACGHPRWNQTEELHLKPFHIKLKIEKAAEGSDYEDRNIPNGYDPITVHRALAVQPTAPASVAPSAAFPGGAPVAPAAPQQQFAAPQAPVAPQQPQAPVQQPTAPTAAPQQPWTPPAQPTQPWEQPAQQAPVQQPAPVQQEPVKSPEQIAWEAQQAQLAAQPQAPVAPVAPAAPVQPEAPVAAQPAAATPPWATQTASPAPQQAAPAQAATTPAEPPHPAQAQVPPWQQPQA